MSDTFFVHTPKQSLRFRLKSNGHLQHECEGRVYHSALPVESTAFRQVLMRNNTKIQGTHSVANKPYDFRITFDGGDSYFFQKVPATPQQQRATAWAMLTHNRVGRPGLLRDDVMALVARKAGLM